MSKREFVIHLAAGVVAISCAVVGIVVLMKLERAPSPVQSVDGRAVGRAP